jgi:hypothetical protein
MPVGTMKIKYAEQSVKAIRIHKHNNKKHKHNNKKHNNKEHKRKNKNHNLRIAVLSTHKSAALKCRIILVRSVSWELRFRGGSPMV